MVSNLTFWQARELAVAGTPIRRAGWVDRWISYDLCLWWVTPYDPITKVRSARSVVVAAGWSRAEFLATDWTAEDPTAKDLPVTLTWTLPKEDSTTLGKFAETSFKNPFSTVATCDISAPSFDDDLYIPKLGQYLFGIDHACRGSYYNDPAQRRSVLFTIGPGESVNLEAWDAVSGNEGGINTLIFAEI